MAPHALSTATLDAWIPGLRLYHRGMFTDARGDFLRLFSAIEGFFPPSAELYPKEINVVSSRAGVIRGMHRQPRQKKLVWCLSGMVLDVVLHVSDGGVLGPFAFVLYPGSGLLVPDNCFHGVQSLEESTMAYYSTEFWDPKTEEGIDAFSPEIEDMWVMLHGGPIQSDRDSGLPSLEAFLSNTRDR